MIVVAALIRNGVIYSMPRPARHGDIMKAVDQNHGETFDPFLPDEQGFLTDKGRFVGRAEARDIAIDARQIVETQWGGQLYSEDLW